MALSSHQCLRPLLEFKFKSPGKIRNEPTAPCEDMRSSIARTRKLYLLLFFEYLPNSIVLNLRKHSMIYQAILDNEVLVSELMWLFAQKAFHHLVYDYIFIYWRPFGPGQSNPLSFKFKTSHLRSVFTNITTKINLF